MLLSISHAHLILKFFLCLQSSNQQKKNNSLSNTSDSSNQHRWDSAVDIFKKTEPVRRLHDHRASLASVVGLYIDNDQENRLFGTDMIVALQPDRSSGRKLLFMNLTPSSYASSSLVSSSLSSHELLGYVELGISQKTRQENMSNETDTNNDIAFSSILRGMEVEKHCRGKGFSTLFLSIWLKLCIQANVTPETVSINKPLLALTLSRCGFIPKSTSTMKRDLEEKELDSNVMKRKTKKKKVKIRHIPLQVEVSSDNEGSAYLYSENFFNLKAGFTDTELYSQRLVLLEEPNEPRGRLVEIRTPYIPPNPSIGYGDNVLYNIRLGSETHYQSNTLDQCEEENIGGSDNIREESGSSSCMDFINNDSNPQREDEEERISKYILTGKLPGFGNCNQYGR